jgi:hypothetical protein
MDLKMTVIKDTGHADDVQFECIDLLDVDFQEFDRYKHRFIYYIGDQAYYSINTLEDSEKLLRNYDFFFTDKRNLVNMRKVKYIDYEYRNLYFDNPPKPNAIFASIAAINLKILKPLIERIIHCNNGITKEFKLKGDIVSCITAMFASRRD